jgi:diacylglycerol kinase family enzyme
MRRRFYLIANPEAGLTGSPLLDDVNTGLERAGAHVTRVRPANPQAARAQVAQAAAAGDYDAIVAAGGDGTVRQAAVTLLDSPVPLGIVPAGTGNVLAHEIGLPQKASVICDTLLHGPTISAACARANGEPFLLMAGAGFDGRVIATLDHRFKSYFGKAAYAGPMVGALVRPMDALTLTVDGHKRDASWVVVANARHYGGRFVMAPRTGIQERGLQAILFKARNQAVLIGQLMSLVSGTLDARCDSHGDVEMLRCSKVTITSRHPVPTQIDGDVFGETPLDIDEGVSHLRLIVPATSQRQNSR